MVPNEQARGEKKLSETRNLEKNQREPKLFNIIPVNRCRGIKANSPKCAGRVLGCPETSTGRLWLSKMAPFNVREFGGFVKAVESASRRTSKPITSGQ